MKRLKSADIKSVVIYARYSCDKQSDNSVEDQIDVCRKYATSKGYDVIDVYSDRAMTGRNAKRPGFQKMIRDSDSGLFDGILVYSLDRFSRERCDHAMYKKMLSEKGIKVLSATEFISDDPSSIIVESMIEGFSQYYVEMLSINVSRGMYSKAKEKRCVGGPIPLGYTVENGTYVEDKAQSAVVKEIFQKFADGWSYQQMCKDFNDRGLKTAKGEPFNKNSFFTILRNRKYLGFYIYGDVEIPGGMPQIIPDELFSKVAARMELNKKAPGRNRAKAEYLLTQKMYCGYCGEMMIGHSSNQISKKGVIYNYYRCKDAGGRRPCKKKMIGKDYIEDLVIKECKSFLTESNIRRIAKEIIKIAHSDEAYAILHGFEASLQKLQREQKNQMVNLRKCDSDLVREMIISDLDKIALEIKDTERQIQIEKANHITITEEQVIDRLSKLADGNILDTVYRRSLIRIFVNNIYIYDDKITITFKTGDEEVEITKEILDKIEQGLGDETLCFSEATVHHDKNLPLVGGFCRFDMVRESDDQMQHSGGVLLADENRRQLLYFSEGKM